MMVLCLDGDSYSPLGLLHGQHEIDIESDFFPEVDPYHPQADELQWLANGGADKYDLIVLVNNKGAGLVKGQRMTNQSTRDRTVVIWNREPTEIDVSVYSHMGFSHFSSRGNLWKYVTENFSL